MIVGRPCYLAWMAKDRDAEQMREWLELGDSLSTTNPERFREVVECVREIVEVQGILAGHDDQLVLRDRRPTKRYSA